MFSFLICVWSIYHVKDSNADIILSIACWMGYL